MTGIDQGFEAGTHFDVATIRVYLLNLRNQTLDGLLWKTVNEVECDMLNPVIRIEMRQVSTRIPPARLRPGNARRGTRPGNTRRRTGNARRRTGNARLRTGNARLCTRR
jgi:hypothetical protein